MSQCDRTGLLYYAELPRIGHAAPGLLPPLLAFLSAASAIALRAVIAIALPASFAARGRSGLAARGSEPRHHVSTSRYSARTPTHRRDCRSVPGCSRDPI